MPLRTAIGIIGMWLLACHFVLAAPPEVRPDLLPRVPPKSPAEAAATFSVRPGFHLELMAAEPLVVDPVAIAFDENVRAYVIEMRDYSERRSESLGRVKLLYDDNGDGRYDRAAIFAENLPWPTAVCCWDGGVFMVASPDLLYLKDTDGDDRADVRALVATGFGNLTDKLNVQALPNSLQWAPDGRIHLALGGNASRLSNFAVTQQPALELRGQDLSFDPKRFDLRAEPGGGQWGMSFDALGSKFICSNSHHIQQIMFPSYALRAIPGLSGAAIDIADDGPQAEVFRTSAVEPWRTLRTQWRVTGVTPGLIEGGGRASGYFTSASGITIYQGDAYGAEFLGNAFIADSGSNLIHRKVLTGDVQRAATRASDEKTREFVASSDNWFRPVSLANAPDGCLWACDMYREVVEHPWSLPEPIKKHLDLNAGNDRGRLWRIVPDGQQPRVAQALGTLSTDELLRILGHENSWHRETATRLLYERADEGIVAHLRGVVLESDLPLARIQALRLLVRLVAWDANWENVPWKEVLIDHDEQVCFTALGLLGEQSLSGDRDQQRELPDEIAELLVASVDGSSSLRTFRLALLLPSLKPAMRSKLMHRLCETSTPSRELANVIGKLAGDDALDLLGSAQDAAGAGDSPLVAALLTSLGRRGKPAEVDKVLAMIETQSQRANRLQYFSDGLRQSGKPLTTIAARQSLQKLADRAIAVLNDKNSKPLQRVESLQVLGLVGGEATVPAIVATINADTSQDESQAAIAAIEQLQPQDLAALLPNLYAAMPAHSRHRVLELWRSRKMLLPDLLAAVRSEALGKEAFSATDLAALRGVSDAAIRSQVAELFGEASTREAAWEKYRPALSKPGAMLAGQNIFRAKCLTCHRKQGMGEAVGPDLDAVATAGKEKILGNILDPSREITAGYMTGSIETQSGEIATGILVAEAGGNVTLRIPGKGTRLFTKPEIAEFQRLPKSLMPDGIEGDLSVPDMANLLEFLATTKLPTNRRLPLNQYRDAEGEIATIHTPAEWQLRRQDILKRMQELMGEMPGDDRRLALAPKVLEESDCGTYARRLITLTTDRDNQLPVYLLVPKKLLLPEAMPASAVLCLHPTDDVFGHKVVVGLGGKANRAYAAELAERGFVTVAPAYPLLANYQPSLEKLGYASGTMKAIWDNRRVLDYLDTLPYVTKGKYAAIGHSLGGHNSVYTAAFDERIKVVVTSCGLDLFADYKQGDITGWTSARYMPRLAAFKGRVQELPVDFDEIIAAIAPRTVHIIAPLNDDNFRAESVDRIVANARPIFRLLGAEDELSVEHPDCAHDFPNAAREAAYKLIEKHLGKP